MGTYLQLFFILILLPAFSFLNADSLNTNFELSQKEKNWISEHQVINFTGDPNWLPIEAFDDSGNYIGIVSDILKIVEERTGIKFNKIATDSWSDSIKLFKDGSVDVITETTGSPLNDNHLFSNHFFSTPIIVIMRNGGSYVDSLSQLRGKKIALIKDYGYVDKIKNKYKQHDFYEVNSIQEGLENVANGKYDVVIATMADGSFNIRDMQLSNINVVGRTEFSTNIGFTISHKYKPLVEIFNRVFKSIDIETKQKILMKWVVHEYIEKIDYKLIAQLLFVAFLIISGTLFWSIRLKKEIARRVIVEIENKKMLEQQARYAALGEMMDAVAHQWKQPLNAIVMLNELLVIDYKEDEVTEAYLKEYQSDMDGQVEHLLSTLAEFRTFFRPNKEIEEFNLLESINSVLLLVKDEFLKNTITIQVECPEKITIEVIKNEFKHILLNIINNAKDAFIQNNTKERIIVIRVEQVLEKVEIEISDNAGGIPKQILPNIFKANVTSKAEGKGTGIGLYMSKQIADKMSAELSATNRDNGAVFKFCI